MKATLPAELQDDNLSDDSDNLPSDLDDSDNVDEDEDENEEVASKVVDDDDDDDGDVLSLVEDSDAEDLLPLDADVPDGLIEYDGSDAEDEDETEEWGGISSAASKKRKRGGEEDKKKRKKIHSLPTFASYEDYAKMIEDGPEDNI
jgi:ribosome biogenesis protein MAK21